MNKNSQSGLISLVGSEIVAGNLYTMVYSASLGLFWIIINPRRGCASRPKSMCSRFGAKGERHAERHGGDRETRLLLLRLRRRRTRSCGFHAGTTTSAGRSQSPSPTGLISPFKGSGQGLHGSGVSWKHQRCRGAFSDPFSTAEVNDLTMTTDQVGHGVALTWSYAGKSIFAYNQPSSSSNFTARGGDYTAGFIPNPTPKSTGVQYWNFGWAITNVSNINSLNYTFQGVNFSERGRRGFSGD